MATKTIFYQILPKNTPKTSKKGLKTPKIPLFWPFFHDFSWFFVATFFRKSGHKVAKTTKSGHKVSKKLHKTAKIDPFLQVLGHFYKSLATFVATFQNKSGHRFSTKIHPKSGQK